MMEGGKRKYEPPSEASNNALAVVVKKQKTEEDFASRGKELMTGPPRTSNLAAPTLLLTGHEAEIHTVKFDPSGKLLASGSFDKKILLWDVFGDSTNFGVLEGHKNAVLEVQWSADSTHLFSASADCTMAVWEVSGLRRIRRFTEHQSFVNSCCVSRTTNPQFLVSGSDDKTAKLWDTRAKKSTHTFEHKYQVTSVCFSQNADQIFTGGIDNKIRVWDIRKNCVAYKLTTHRDTVTGLELSPDGSFLLSNSMDNTLQISDIRPYVSQSRCVGVLPGVVHGVDQNLLKCCWSPDGSKISAGSADRFVTIWDVASRKILYKLPGHTGTVNEVDFHPSEPIIVSASADKKIYLGEIEK